MDSSPNLTTAWKAELRRKAVTAPRVTSPKQIIHALRCWQPTANDIRSEGRCPNCKSPNLVSYITIEFYRPSNSGQECCGYYCGWCGWGNAGRRETVDEIADMRTVIRL